MKKQFLYPILLFAGLLIFDSSTKLWAESAHLIRLSPGFMGGLLQTLAPSTRTIVVTGLLGPVLAAYLFALLFLHGPFIRVSYSLSILLAGLFGNTLDRIKYTVSAGFIQIPTFFTSMRLEYFDFADLFVGVGFFWTAYLIFFPNQAAYYKNNLRKQVVVDRKEQVRLALTMTAVCFSVVLFLGLYSISFLRETYQGYYSGDTYLSVFAWVFFGVSLVFLALLFGICLIVTNRISGPIFAFSRYVDELLVGNAKPLKLREEDQLKKLEEIAVQLNRICERKLPE